MDACRRDGRERFSVCPRGLMRLLSTRLHKLRQIITQADGRQPYHSFDRPTRREGRPHDMEILQHSGERDDAKKVS